ncbi:MAG: hypothetical protein K9N51_07520 [Candidatus Pacebacteria bacterium]|nr:hypothetical protein [Candidatus Paceibacterota bacterium]
MSKQYVISIMTHDRVGIVADVTNAIKELNGNLADLSQTVLAGYFTMIVAASFPESVTTETIRTTLNNLDPEEPFEVGIKIPAQELRPEPLEYSDDHFVLTAVGPDKMGLLAAVSSYLRDHTINIGDLATCVHEGKYTMILSIDLPPDIDVGHFRKDMQEALRTIGVMVELQHYNIFQATNEV